MRNTLISILFIVFLSTFISKGNSISVEAPLIIKADKAFPPYEYLNEKNEPEGFNIDLINNVMMRINRPYIIESDDWGKVLDSFYKRDANILSGLIYSNERSENILFSNTHSVLCYQVICRNEDAFKYNILEDLNNKKIFISDGEIISEILKELSCDKNVIKIENMEEGIKKLSSGMADIAIASEDVAKYIIEENNLDNLSIIDVGIPTMEYCIAVNQDRGLLLQINRALVEMKKDGTFNDIYDKWFPSKKILKRKIILYTGIAVVVLVLLTFYGIGLYLNKKIKKITNEINLQNKKYQTLFKNTVAGLEYYNKDGILIDLNEADCRIFGISDKNVLLKNQVSIYDNPLLAEFFDDNKLQSNYKKVIKYDLRRDSRDKYFAVSEKNEIIYVETKINLLYSDNGELDSIICTSLDVSEKYVMDKKLKESGKLIQMAISAEKLITWTYDFKTKTISFGENETNLPFSAGLNDYSAFIYSEDREKVFSMFNSIAKNEKESASCIARYVLDDGTCHYFKMIMTAFIVKGKVTKIIGSSKDIDEEYTAQKKIKRLSACFDLALEAANIYVWTYNFDTESFNVIKGVEGTIKSIPIKDYFQKIHNDDVEMCHAVFEKLLNGELVKTSVIYRCYGENDRILYYRCYYITEKVDNKVVTLIGTSENITEEINQQKKLEDSLNKLKYTLKGVNASFFEFDVSTQFIKLYNDPINQHDENKLIPLKKYCSFFFSEKDNMLVEFENVLINGINKNISFEAKQRYFSDDNTAMVSIHVMPFSFDNNGKVTKYVGIKNDITQLHSFSKQLYNANNEKEILLKHLPVAILTYDENYMLNYVNDAAYNLLDIKNKGQLNNKKILLFDDPNIEPYYKEQIKKGEFIDTVIKYNPSLAVDADLFYSPINTNLYFDIKIRYIKGDDGEINKTIIMMSDITEKQKYEADLKKNISKTKYAIQSANIAFLDYDVRKNQFLTINDPLAEYDENKVISFDNYKKVALPEDVDKILSLEYIMMNQINKSYSIDVKFLYPDGEIHCCNISGIPFEIDNNGKVLRYVGFRKDNTEIIKLNLKIKDYVDKLRYIIESSKIIIWDFDVKSSLLKLNSAFSCVPSTMTFEEYIEHIPLEERGKFKKDFENMLSNKNKTFSHNRKITLDINDRLSIKHIIISGIIHYDENDNFIGCSGLVRDITDLILIQERLEQEKIKAERADKLKSAFLANMSHEIRTPLNAIVGFSELLTSTEDEKEKEDYINIINKNNELLLRLIGDILDLSKIESGLIELKNEQFDISKAFDETYMSLKNRCDNPNIEFLKSNPYSKCVVHLDRNRFVQILTNFATNAIKYTAKGYILLKYEHLDGGIKVSVQDTGIGISKEKHNRIFQRFEKLDDFAQGTGLGLAICKAIVERQNGLIGFESEKDKGSCFWAWLPCKVEMINETKDNLDGKINIVKENSNLNLKKLDGFSILVAEDNDSNFMLVKAILKDYKLSRAINGKEAVDLAKNNRYNAILMDMKMPIMNGLEATKEIRTFDMITPIIALTANAFDSDKKMALEAGCNAFIAKPIKKEELQKILLSD
ncbi:MAG: transporter substrate-binding domain-containing protein [Bacteroidales bacterium]|nr:transporter substrate-binding domain-containing protein [Bacteroidales bacterium]